MVNRCIENGGGASVDGVYLKANVNNYYDITVDYMRVKDTRAHEEPRFHRLQKSLVLAAGPDVTNASNIREQLEVAWLQKYRNIVVPFLQELYNGYRFCGC